MNRSEPPDPHHRAPPQDLDTRSHGPPDAPDRRRLVRLSLVALGVVFGDIGTSPLYAIRECFHGEYGVAVIPENVLGVLSLVFWSLLMVVTLKYLTFIVRADNHGEGGVIALTALLRSNKVRIDRRVQWSLISIGVFAACLLYGDGMITPAISVLSAVEGVRVITPVLDPYVVPLTIAILAGLFFFQRHGTTRVGRLFGPVMLAWFCVLALLGLVQIAGQPRILAAMAPWHAAQFFVLNRVHGFVVLGAVFLVVTGAEALYADMGHFGIRPIRWSWLGLVLPALLLNYFGQGALLLSHPESASHVFYAMVPSWAMVPMVALATMATIIASQAVISGSFSLTRQALQLGYLPRLNITHTSSDQIGQIYVAPVNWLLMVCAIGLVIGFHSSSKLAAAYGVAVTSTMLITTILFFVIAVYQWGWSWWVMGTLTAALLLMDFCFFAANISKLFHGAWFPLVIAAVLFTLMLTWKRGRELLRRQLIDRTPPLNQFLATLDEEPPKKVRGQAIFLTGNPEVVPAALIQNVTHNKILHSEVAVLNVKTEDIPRVPSFEKVEVEKLEGGFYRVLARCGFMEEPRIDNILALAREKGLDFKVETTSFFLGREKLSMDSRSRMSRWRAQLFLLMSRNAMDASSFFDIPPDRIIEVGVQLQL